MAKAVWLASGSASHPGKVCMLDCVFWPTEEEKSERQEAGEAD